MDYVVQSLSIDSISLRSIEGNRIVLSWRSMDNLLKPIAKANQYIIYIRTGEGDLDNDVIVDTPDYQTNIPSGVVCSSKVTALNKGGENFPSEILSTEKTPNEKGTVLVVNGFSRASGSTGFTADVDALAGFLDELDHGAPYQTDISYIGPMKEFRQQIPWMSDGASGFGDSYGTHKIVVTAGNSFDYPTVYGEATLRAGYSSVSCGLTPCFSLRKKNGGDSITNQMDAASGGVPILWMSNYEYVDLILGKRCQSKMEQEGAKSLESKTFSEEIQNAISDYYRTGSNFFISGVYVASGLWDNRSAKADEKNKRFTMKVLKYKWRTGQAVHDGKVRGIASLLSATKGNYIYHQELNPESYVVESPDAIEPAVRGASTVL